MIDLDAAVHFNGNAHVGLKYSSAFLPPEMFWKDGDNVVRVRSLQNWTADAGYDLVLAAPAHDIWSLGCVLFLLCTGITLVCGNVIDDLMYEEDFIKLWEWTEATKRSKLSQLKNHLARNLLSLLLMKNPRSRLDASHVLSHPFQTGVCFLVNLLSRDAIKCPTRDWHNIEKLAEGSKCDNVLLEWRLALELHERGMIEGIFPVMIGDKRPYGEYSNYFSSGCNPNPPDIVVHALESKLIDHLGREGLGSP